MISVILANYNGAKFLEEAIQSVIDQRFNEYELIIIDDGSTDNSRNLISKYAHHFPDKIKPIFSLRNKGQGESFNRGFSETKGDLICFMDSDDVWLPDKLSNVSNYFDLGHKNIAFLQHNLFLIRHNTVTKENYRNTLISGNLYKTTQEAQILPVGFTPTTGLTFPRSILEKILPIPQEFRICADGFLTRTALCFGDIASVSESWGGYRVHSDNHTFENPQHNNRDYVTKLLVPALNTFYEVNNLKIRILKNIFIIKLIEYSLPPIIPKSINYLYRKYQEKKEHNVI